ncbi:MULTISPECIES: SDR family NAD(P)-dependent oxidoreductase [unclassified Streptococcus]|uniref:SDR family NAD(P)-dependent oxidoreductase n=1 Tax=unclassified Streptococcus TaxID=2608887 RepID=UPI002A8F6B9A|nr:SDR family oxidoreductase [Streptococcus sp.]MDY3823775.1 SDR family oxidoreductase [Streptococcus sp.]
MRTIVITGASGGLAEAIIKKLPDDGLILLGRSKERLIEKYGHMPNVTCHRIDLSDTTAMENLVSELYQQYGKIDIWVNNAGFGEFKAFDDFSDQDIKAMFEVNTFATMTFSRLVGERMKQEKSGQIINIASMAGLIASNKSSVYSASKFAVIGFSNALRLELADDHVYVTTVNPGPIKTAFFDQADPSGEYLKSVERFVLTPEVVASKTVKAFGKNKREINLPYVLQVTHKVYTLFPRLSDFLARKVFNYK